MQGRFYESQFARADFLKLRVGLADCPHIPADKIARLREQYGPDGATPNAAFLASTLDGMFMEASNELRFNPTGLKRLTDMAALFDTESRSRTRLKPQSSPTGELVENSRGLTWHPSPGAGWLWMCEEPKPGWEYL